MKSGLRKIADHYNYNHTHISPKIEEEASVLIDDLLTKKFTRILHVINYANQEKRQQSPLCIKP